MLHCIPLIFRLAVTFLLESDESQIISYSPFKGYLLATWYCYAGDVQRMSRKNFSGCLVGVDSARRWSPLGLSRLVVVIFFFLGVIFFLGGHLLFRGASASWWSSSWGGVIFFLGGHLLLRGGISFLVEQLLRFLWGFLLPVASGWRLRQRLLF